ncbi:methyltransferase family protein [Sediminicoccus sp. BL-A-41-H5]|uniref:methyltransferase family protein n=1 Tax=Sediminicoccus sp. BL-A-41-H5 TaxID=3421106 RepID=UPI003D674BB1
MPETDHGPGVRIPPPVMVAVALGFAWGLQKLLPVQLGPPAVALGGMVIFLAMGWVGWALLVLVRAGNDPRPDKPDTAFVAAGPYRFGRNPIYFGFLLFLAGVALSWGTLWAWLAVGATFIALDVLVVRKEEAYLRTRFPESYPAYLARTRRWL